MILKIFTYLDYLQHLIQLTAKLHSTLIAAARPSLLLFFSSSIPLSSRMAEPLLGRVTSLAERMISHFSDHLSSVGKPHIVAAALVVFAMAIATIVTPKLDPREPPLIAPRLPLVGHLLGLMVNRVGYFGDL